MNKIIKEKRKKIGLSQAQLAYLTDIPLSTIQAYEQGKRKIEGASIKNILSLERILKINLIEEIKKNH